MGGDALKRFAVFAGDNYYPWGGFSDLVGTFDDKDEAIAEAKKAEARIHDEWSHVIDLQTGEWVYEK